MIFRLLSLLAPAGLLCGCTYATARVDFPDGTTVKAKYIVIAQNRSLKYDPKTGAFESRVSNEPVGYFVKEAVPLVKVAGAL